MSSEFDDMQFDTEPGMESDGMSQQADDKKKEDNQTDKKSKKRAQNRYQNQEL